MDIASCRDRNGRYGGDVAKREREGGMALVARHYRSITDWVVESGSASASTDIAAPSLW